jgi:hypothetical protein
MNLDPTAKCRRCGGLPLPTTNLYDKAKGELDGNALVVGSEGMDVVFRAVIREVASLI